MAWILDSWDVGVLGAVLRYIYLEGKFRRDNQLAFRLGILSFITRVRHPS